MRVFNARACAEEILQYAQDCHENGREPSIEVAEKIAATFAPEESTGAVCEGPHNYDELIKPRDGYNDHRLRPW